MTSRTLSIAHFRFRERGSKLQQSSQSQSDTQSSQRLFVEENTSQTISNGQTTNCMKISELNVWRRKKHRQVL
jgi:hypothetical protein